MAGVKDSTNAILFPLLLITGLVLTVAALAFHRNLWWQLALGAYIAAALAGYWLNRK
jgi:hypothetical protein